jgi:outer membrane protein assembly factor BamD (BamD/ComL family)
MKKLILFTVIFIFSLTCIAQKGKWKKAQKINTIESYQEFLRDYPNSEFNNEAEQKLIELEFNKAKKINTISSYKYFLNSYGINKYTKQATSNMIKLEFLEAQKKNTIKSYMEFSSKYPDGELSEQAKYAISDIDFRIAKSKNSVEELRYFIKKYPNSSLTNEALKLIMDMEFEEVKKANTIDAYELYIKKYPNSENTKQANLNLTSLIEEKNEWEKVIRNPTLASYFHFVSIKPDSKMILNNEMLKKIVNDARPRGNYFDKSNEKLKFNLDNDDNLVRFYDTIELLKKGVRISTSPPKSQIIHNNSAYFIIFYSINDDPLVIDLYQDKFVLNLSHFKGHGYVLIKVRKNEKMKIWDLN